jgi:RimJ/RimL family protein N-acetyltransferase
MITKRILLRQWEIQDFVPFAEINSNPDVMKHFPKTLNQIESDCLADKIKLFIKNNGWGLWAVELMSTGEFIGFVGLNKPKENLPFAPCVEVGWRLANKHWGQGYATEAAKRALNYAFSTLGLEEVVAFTTPNNIGSLTVMNKIGMTYSGLNFMHPDIDQKNRLCEHVLYKITNKEWKIYDEFTRK